MTASVRGRAGRSALPLLFLASLAACEDPGNPYAGGGGPCNSTAPPLALGAADRLLTDVNLEVQIKGIVAKVIVEDPDGLGDFAGVMQRIEVFHNASCMGAPLFAQNQIASTGVPVTFGTVVRAEYYPDLYQAIARANYWPVRVKFTDENGAPIQAMVRARVVDRLDD